MKNLKTISAAALTLALIAIPTPFLSVASSARVQAAAQQQSTGALERGYRTGYSDGYQAGYSDTSSRAPRDFRNKEDYQRADRAYASSYGTLEDYRDGYQQGFEAGYAAGYDRRPFDSTIPTGITRRGTTDAQADDYNSAQNTSGSNSGANTAGNSTVISNNTSSSTPVLIPAQTIIMAELLTNLSTDATQRGDRFQARIIEPQEYAGAMIDGHVSRIKRAGKVSGTSEIQLAFDQIRLPDNRWANFSAQLLEVITPGNSGAGGVDEEGGVRGRDSTRDDVTKIGTGSAIGAIIGAIAGGGKGAAIGAVIGGGVTTGGVLASRGKDIRLEHGQELRLRTHNDTRIQ